VLTWPFARFDIAGGRDNDRLGAIIIVVDHRSLFDVVAGLVVLHRFKRYPRVLIEKKYVDSKWTRPFARAIGAIPVDRKAGHGEAFRAAVEALHEGVTILILPEGRLHWDPEDPLTTGPSSTGVARLAEAANVPIVCAGMVGTEEVWPATSKLPRLVPFRRRRITVRVGDEPLPLVEGDQREQTDQVMAEVVRLMTIAQADADAAAG